jgi:hypothetical protein
MGTPFLGQIKPPEPFLRRKRGYDPNQFTTHGGDGHQNATGIGFTDLDATFFPVPFLEFEINGVIENYLFCFCRGDGVLGEVSDIAVVPIEHES